MKLFAELFVEIKILNVHVTDYGLITDLEDLVLWCARKTNEHLSTLVYCFVDCNNGKITWSMH